MYVVFIKTPANDNPKKMVDTFFVGKKKDSTGCILNEWDEDIKFAAVYTDLRKAKWVVTQLRKLKGSDSAKWRLKEKFSKN